MAESRMTGSPGTGAFRDVDSDHLTAKVGVVNINSVTNA
jgi:hypothetical protein